MKIKIVFALLIITALLSCRRDAEIAALEKMQFNSGQLAQGSEGN